MNETIGINLELPLDFSVELDRILIDFKETGIRKSKAQFIIELAKIGLNNEKREYAKIKKQ